MMLVDCMSKIRILGKMRANLKPALLTDDHGIFATSAIAVQEICWICVSSFCELLIRLQVFENMSVYEFI
jgi:hypothetical protein